MLIILVLPVRWYVFENGTDLDQCGQSVQAACRTMDQVIRQLGTITPLATLDLLGQVEDVWTGASEQIQNASDYLDKYHYSGMPVLQEFPALPQLTTNVLPWFSQNWIIPNLDVLPDGAFNWETTTYRPTSTVRQTTSLSQTPHTPKTPPNLPKRTTTRNYRIEYYTIQPDITGPPITSVLLCDATGQVNHGIFDNACHQTKMIYLRHVNFIEDKIYLSRELDHFCTVKRDMFIKRIIEYCENPWHFQLLQKKLQFYRYAHMFLHEIQLHIISELQSVHFET